MHDDAAVTNPFENPEAVAASIRTAEAGLWDVEREALPDPVVAGGVGGVLVDLGCGAGRLARVLGAEADEVVLVDSAQAMLDEAASMLAQLGPVGRKITCLRVDVRLLSTSSPASELRADLSRGTLVTCANLLCYVRGRETRIELLRALLADLSSDAGLLVTQHVVPGQGVEELLEQAAADRPALTAADDELFDTTSTDGAYVHWFVPDHLASELSAAAGAPVTLHVSADGLRAAAFITRAES